MDFTQLRYFLKAAELQNFTKAAEACGISQPALSQQVARLESQLGVKVFERCGRSVALTDEGRLFYERAQEVVSLVDRVTEEFREAKRTGGVLRIGAIPTLAPVLLPKVISEFNGLVAEGRVEVVEDVTESLVEDCRHGRVDFAFLVLPLEEEGLATRVLFREDLLLCVPASHTLAKRESVALDEMRDEPFILLGEAHCLTDDILGFCRQREFRPAIRGRNSQLATVLELVRVGLGVSLVPASTAERDASEERTYVRVAGEPQRTVALVWNPHRRPGGLATVFEEVLATLYPESAPVVT